MAAKNTDTYTSIALKMRSIDTLCEVLKNQNPNSPTLDDESTLGIKKMIDNLTQEATVIVQSPLQALEEQCFKTPLKKCPTCGKFKIAGRQMVHVLDAVRRFKCFASQHQQPSATRLVSDEDGYSRIKQTSLAIVQQWKSSQETIMEDETLEPEWEDVQGARQSLSRTNRKKNQTQHRKRYDVILAPTLMNFEAERENSGSSSDSSSASGSRRSCASGSYSSYSDGSNYQRTSSSRSIVSGTPDTIYSGSSIGDEEEQHSRGRMLDDRRGYRSRSRSPSDAYSCNSSRSASRSRSRSPVEEYSHRRSHYSKAGPSNPSHEKMGWFGRAKNKIGNMFHHHRDHHRHPRDNVDVSTSREDRNARTHQRSKTGNPGNNVVLHRQSKEQKVTKNTRRTPVKNKQGHLKKLTGGFFSHFVGSKKSKPSTAEKRRLERTVTGNGKVTAKKLDWLENIHGRRLPGGTKYPKSKGSKPNNKLKRLM
ncbi:hypothetical protein MKW92_038792 [Papaver armeniacum]|nr:hypothetical protein MKW92_038792 [Papaver armeniacum]